MLLFGTLLILAGQLFSMGILAEIQVRTYHEFKGSRSIRLGIIN
jgi:hypothetical protein